MTAVRLVDIQCDGCEVMFNGCETSARVGRALARKEGWARDAFNRDLCPDCLKDGRAM